MTPVVQDATNGLAEVRCCNCGRYLGAHIGRGVMPCTRCGGWVSYTATGPNVVADVAYVPRADRLAGHGGIAPSS